MSKTLASLLLFASIAPTLATRTPCSKAAISCPKIPGTKVLEISANPVQNYSTTTYQNGNIPKANWAHLDFCNVTVTYSHTGFNDRTHVQIWLPLDKEQWNGRFQGTGGGGYVAGLGDEALAPAIAAGYSAACTDAGHPAVNDAESWALESRGHVNNRLLENFASTSLEELAIIGKAVTRDYYEVAPTFSYWTGCSTGGRQGMMLAQRYPTAFDGILAMAPAINWPDFEFSEFWPQQVMNTLDYYPQACELSFLTAAAIDACDGLDGVVDGIISLPEKCSFDPAALVGTPNTACNGSVTVTKQAAEIASALWTGPVDHGRKLWYGLNKDAPLAGLPGLTLGETNCTGSNSCIGVPFVVSEEWIRLFTVKDKTFDTSSMSNKEFFKLYRQSLREYQNIIGTADPDLEPFYNAGGKILTWQGLADQLIMPNGTSYYYDEVAKHHHGSVEDFYRVFFAPGTPHCAAGVGPYPYDALDALVDWVEHGQAPKTLAASIKAGPAKGTKRNLCMYPKVQTYVGGHPGVPSSFTCS